METESCCVLARKQIEVYMDAYGECRDSERTFCVREPVGMANCVGSALFICCVLARKQIEVYMDAYGECRDN